MNLLYQVKYKGKIHPVGKYNGGFSKEVEADLKSKGYFALENKKAK